MALNNLWALVIEDDAHSLIAISNLLREQGIRFKRNTTGANVLEQLRSMQPQPDFILLDLNLPQANAFDLVTAIRREPQLAEIPIICLGDSTTHQSLERAQQCGCHGYLAKPLPRRHFADLIRRILNGEQFWARAV
ncbi:Polar-differentiation response regulator DivK [Gammaproteobacteria bacterium]|nr:Polar-differentiation response regulator DivK [Gammaproteobacteria bacterium]